MGIGNIIALVGLLITILGFATTYGMLKKEVERNTKDIDFLNKGYSNIYSSLTDIRVQIASVSTKLDEWKKENK